MKLSRVVESIPPSGIRKFFDAVSQIEGVISLGVGEPDFATPWSVRESAMYRLERGNTTYTSNQGLIELREAIADHIDERQGVRYRATDQILVTVGVSEALDLALRALLNPGDEVIIPEPSYVSYSPCVQFAGGVPVILTTRLEDGFVPTSEDVERLVTPRTRAILLNYPNNPTGAVLDRHQMDGLAEVANRHDLVVISDEIYGRLTYAGTHQSFVGSPGMVERTLLLDGFSKTYAMTGWRIGYAVGPAPLIAAMTKIHQYTALCASRTAQEAAIEALQVSDHLVQEMVDEYDRRRRTIVAGLNRIGLDCHLPGGAFYAFPSIAATGLASEEFAQRLLRESRVAVVPGDAFGQAGTGHIRCSYATSLPQIEEALDRIEAFVQRLPATPSPRASPVAASSIPALSTAGK